MTDSTIPDASYTALFRYAEGGPTVSAETAIRAIGDAMAGVAIRDEADAIERTSQSSTVGDFALGWNAAVTHVLREFRARADELAPPETDAADGLPL